MMHCKEVATLLSRALDEPLSFQQRLHVRFHLAMCKLCRLFAGQVRAVKRLSRILGAAESSPMIEGHAVSARLSPEQKARLKSAISRGP